MAFAQGLLEEQAVAVVPGSAFGDASRGRVRLTLAASWTQIERALDRMADYATQPQCAGSPRDPAARGPPRARGPCQGAVVIGAGVALGALPPIWMTPVTSA